MYGITTKWFAESRPFTRTNLRTSKTSFRPYRNPERRLAGSISARTSLAHSRRLAAVRRQGTSAELAVRNAMRELRLRFTIKNGDLPGSPDLANRTKKFAIFVHGCFWHRHANCARSSTPKSNRAFWAAKFTANRSRDRRVVKSLRKLGYRVVVIWECESKDLGRTTATLRKLLLCEVLGTRA